MKSSMSVAAWKIVLVSLALCCGVLNLFALTTWARVADPAVAGTLGASFQRDVPGRQVRVVSLDAGSVLRRAGVAVGDRLRFDHAADWTRSMGTNETIGFTLLRGATASHVDVSPSSDPDVVAHPQIALMGYLMGVMSAFWTIFLGLIVALRNMQRPALISFALAMIATSCDQFTFNLPGGSLQSIFYDLRQFAFFVTYVGMVNFALRYVEDGGPWTCRWVRSSFTAYVVASLCAIVYFVLFRIGALAAKMPPLATWAFATFAVVSSASVWSALAWSWWHARGALRQRVAWTGVSMGLIYGSYLALNAGELLHFEMATAFVNFGQEAVIFAAYLILAYGLLRHRLFDIGFAINRTVVFTTLSTLLLLAFAVTEFAVDKLLHFEGREKNVVFDAVVALGVILSFHRIQHWVSHQVDSVFFKNWHTAAKALRHTMEKAAHITEPEVLRERFAEAVAAFAAGAGCAIYQRVERMGFDLQHGTLPDVPALLGKDDDAVLEMRAAGTWVYLDTLKTAARGQLAFPILARGDMQGVVVVGAKALGQLYRPDELSLLATSVQQLGQDLEVLRADALEQRLVALAQQADALVLEKQNIAREAFGLRQLLQHRLTGAA